jgi:hypothetical protein
MHRKERRWAEAEAEAVSPGASGSQVDEYRYNLDLTDARKSLRTSTKARDARRVKSKEDGY